MAKILQKSPPEKSLFKCYLLWKCSWNSLQFGSDYDLITPGLMDPKTLSWAFCSLCLPVCWKYYNNSPLGNCPSLPHAVLVRLSEAAWYSLAKRWACDPTWPIRLFWNLHWMRVVDTMLGNDGADLFQRWNLELFLYSFLSSRISKLFKFLLFGGPGSSSFP